MAFNEEDWTRVSHGTYKIEHGAFTFMKKELHMNGTLWQIWQSGDLLFSSTRKYEFLSKATLVRQHGCFTSGSGTYYRLPGTVLIPKTA